MRLERITTEELEKELKKRKNRQKIIITNLKKGYHNPIGRWKVTTEGDVEGSTTKQLGVYNGHIVDIALSLAHQSYYSLTFSLPENLMKSIKQKEVSLVLNIDSGTWDMDRDSRVANIENFLRNAESETDFGVEDNNYFASVKIINNEVFK